MSCGILCGDATGQRAIATWVSKLVEQAAPGHPEVVSVVAPQGSTFGRISCFLVSVRCVLESRGKVLDILYPHCAGLDVNKKFVTVAG